MTSMVAPHREFLNYMLAELFRINQDFDFRITESVYSLNLTPISGHQPRKLTEIKYITSSRMELLSKAIWATEEFEINGRAYTVTISRKQKGSKPFFEIHEQK